MKKLMDICNRTFVVFGLLGFLLVLFTEYRPHYFIVAMLFLLMAVNALREIVDVD